MCEHVGVQHGVWGLFLCLMCFALPLFFIAPCVDAQAARGGLRDITMKRNRASNTSERGRCVSMCDVQLGL